MNRSYIRQAQSWPTIHLGDIAQFSNGVNFDKSSYSSEGIRLIGVSNFADRLYPEFDDLSCIQPDAITENDLLAEQDIIFVRSNGNKELVGRSMFIKTLPARTTYSGFCIRARMKDTTKVCPLFYAYYFKSPLFRKSISGVSRGSNIQNLNQGILKSCNVPCPPLAEQRRIADMLSAYDDLIENNRKQIKLLEEAAQRLYKEWFIDLHFPGYEHTKIINGIPDGWRKGKAEEFFSITIGKTPPRAESQWFSLPPDGQNWLSIADMGGADPYILSTSESLTNEAIQKHHIKVVPVGTVLLSFKLTVGRVAIAGIPLCTNEAIAHFHISKSETREYLYSYLHNYNYDSLGSTSSISKAINSSIIKSMPIEVPDQPLLEEFSSRVSSFSALILAKQKNIRDLVVARDSLLPRLMSGEMEISKNER